MLDENREGTYKPRYGLDGTSFGITSYKVTKQDTTRFADDFENPFAFKSMPHSKRLLAKGEAWKNDVTPRETKSDAKQYMANFARKFMDRVRSMIYYDDSPSTGTRDFATFFGWDNVQWLVLAIKNRTGHWVHPDDLFEKMVQIIAQDPSHSADMTNPDREDESDGPILRHVKRLTYDVLDQLSYEVAETNIQWDFYARNLNHPYGEEDGSSYERPIVVGKRDPEWAARMDFLLPEDDDEGRVDNSGVIDDV